jgi:sporulation protein YlmC with PRC-barrel domain
MTTTPTPAHKSSTLISADRVEGTAVFNAKGDKLGHVEDVMLHKLSGKVAYAVISCGGFLGVGEKYHPIPWSLLTYDIDKSGYVLPVEPRQLEEARSFAAGDLEGDDTEWRREVHTYYNAPAYWM